MLTAISTSSDGRTIYFVEWEVLMSVSVTAGDDLRPGRPTPFIAWNANLTKNFPVRSYDVMGSGSFVAVMREEQTGLQVSQLHVVLNFFEELKVRVPH